MQCPNCNKQIIESDLKKEWTPNGIKAKCPKCNKGILFYRNAKNLQHDEKGTLRKVYRAK